MGGNASKVKFKSEGVVSEEGKCRDMTILTRNRLGVTRKSKDSANTTKSGVRRRKRPHDSRCTTMMLPKKNASGKTMTRMNSASGTCVASAKRIPILT